MVTFYLLSSLGTGVLAWILAIVSLCKRRFGLLNLLSFSGCGLSLLLQLMQADYLVNRLEDISAVMDMIPAVVGAGWILLLVTLLLNSISLIRKGGK